MRNCAQCHRPDLPVIRHDLPCTCGADSLVEQGWAPDRDHAADCQKVSHEVVEYVYPHLYRPSELVRDAAGKHSLHGYSLPLTLLRAGWSLREDQRSTQAQRVFGRVKLLCRDCIADEEDRRGRLKEYQRVSRARGKREARGWADSVAQQSLL